MEEMHGTPLLTCYRPSSIAGFGMCTGGRIVNHLKHGLDDPKNDLFFVGYQAKGTPGRAITVVDICQSALCPTPNPH
ncbi:MAG: hypothetical protein U5K27_16860 [Desulfotignum sp.]|nr:hypothetical protein [Desulfotignum sp.]